MKILLSGVQTNNKGAELMLYAILQEIERKHPEAIVYIPRERMFHELSYVNTKLDFRYVPFGKVENTFHLSGIYSRLKIPLRFLPQTIAMGKLDYFIDGSGFRFSDMFRLTKYSAFSIDSQLSAYKRNGTKIVYLPQAFGPFEKKSSKEVLSALNKNATVLMPREKVSLNYLETSGLVDMKKVKMFTDFTSLVEGVFPKNYQHLKDGICIIPNRQMINKGAISMEVYVALLKTIYNSVKESRHRVYLLNHEGIKDEMLCETLKKELYGDVEVVSGLNALEVKGMISSAFLVITSRFHGLASSLNSSVPSLATSWSHKYEELLKDYGLDDYYVLPLNDMGAAIKKVKDLLDLQENERVRGIIKSNVPAVKARTIEMWKTVWNL